MSLATLGLLLLALVAPPPAAEAAPPPKGTGATMRAALDQVMNQPGAPPGISLLLQRKGERKFLSRGVADVETGVRPRPSQNMRIASMSKAFNGAVALALVSEGELDLEDTIGQWLPGVLPLAENVTVAQALQHTGGLPDYIRQDDFVAELMADPGQYMTPLELLSYVDEVPLAFSPGTRYEYSDTDNIVVALIAEAASGLTYDQLLERHVIRPAGLTSTSMPVTVAMPLPFMHGYDISLDGDPPSDVSSLINPALAGASGGIVATPRDVNRFFRAYVGGSLFDERTRRSQRGFVVGSSSPPGPGRNQATLGLFRYRSRCGTLFGHTGSFPGYRLFAAATRNGKRSIVFSVNTQVVPGQGSQEVSDLIRFAQEDATCHLLR